MSQFNMNEDAQSGGGSQSSNYKPNSSEQQPTETAFPDEDEETITMLDVIEREDELEEEASAVLGNSDEKNCTYPKGYISRQALYSCATCSEVTGDVAAICLACSLECHDNHEVFELYTKRNYRCDCGNSKFGSGFKCKLMDKETTKLPFNENNKYNHNFSGRYCICDKKFPPDEDDNSIEANDAMWQCIGCEDWYHTKHLDAEDLPSKFEELVCATCVDKLDFLRHYRNIGNDSDEAIKTKAVDDIEKTEESEAKDSALTSSATTVNDYRSSIIETKTEAIASDIVEYFDRHGREVISVGDTCDSLAENKDPVQIDPVKQTSSSSTQGELCLLENRRGVSDKESSDVTSKGPIFWSDCNWRTKLCRCENCMIMYKAKGCEYLLDDKDTVKYYEAQGKAIAMNRQTPIERGMTALKGMNRVAVVEALNGYDELKADLSSYLRKFADSKKVVREQDIHEFFEQLKSKKRPRLDYT